MADKKEKLKNILSKELVSAVGGSGGVLSRERERLRDAYHGNPLPGDAARRQAGWSTYQDRSVLETVEWAKCPFMRIFSGVEDIVRFEPRHPKDEQNSEDATAYVNRVVFGPDSFMTVHNVISDALCQRVGWAKAFYEDKTEVVTHERTGLTQDEAIALLLTMPGNQEKAEIVINDDTGMYDVTYTTEVEKRGVRIVSVPSEQVLYSPDATDIAEARFVAHWEDRTRASLLAEGYGKSLVMDIADDGKETWPETRARNLLNNSDADADSERGGLMETIRIYEAYVIVAEGDYERRKKVVFAGRDNVTILSSEDWHMPRPPLFPVSSVPVPHSPVGLCLADLAAPIQDLRTESSRQLLDNLALQNQGEFFVQKGDKNSNVDMDQFLARRIGGVYEATGDVSISAMPSSAEAGTQALKILELTDAQKEVRTGIGQSFQGLSADVLQNTATGAVIADDNANMRVELIARIIAETFFKPLAAYALRLVTNHQDKPLQLRLQGRFFQWDPRSWDPEMDVTVNVGLGTGNRAKLLSGLQNILAVQKEFVSFLGPNSPVRMSHLVHTCHKIAQALGFQSPEQFFGSMEDASKAEQAALQQGGKGGEDQKKLELEREKLKIYQQKGQAEMQMKERETRARFQLDQAKAAADVQLEREKAEADIQLERAKAEVNADLKAREMAYEAEFDAVKALSGGINVPGIGDIRQVKI